MNQIFHSAARTLQILCDATRIVLDPPEFHKNFVSFALRQTYGLQSDFYIRTQGVGITVKAEEIPLFYLLQDHLPKAPISFKDNSFMPLVSGNWELGVNNPCVDTFAAISSGNIADHYPLLRSRDSDTFDTRADFLVNLLFTQWIVKMIPTIEHYARFKRIGIIAMPQ